MKERLHRRLAAAFVVVALGISGLFALFALSLQYTLEPFLFERMLDDEAVRQHQQHAAGGHWSVPENPWVVLHTDAEALPPELQTLATEPVRRGVVGPGGGGRQHQVLSLGKAGAGPWLSVEVSRVYVLRPMRQLVGGLVAAWAAAMLLLSAAVGWWLSRHMTGPLARLSERVAALAAQAADAPPTARPGAMPAALAAGLRDDEVGALARRFDALLARTREFIEREQSFTRDASHELRTPLAVLRMAIERLQAEPTLPQPLRQQLLPMHEAVELMVQTVDSLLLLAREQPRPAGAPAATSTATSTAALATRAPVALLPLVERWVLAHSAWLDDSGLALKLRLDNGDGLLLPEPVLRIAIGGLLANAFSHGAPGGGVRAGVTVGFSPGRLCIGNPSAALPERVGEAFVKHGASAGSGLGLAIVRRLLQQHGGSLQIQHADGHTTVCVIDATGACTLAPANG